VYEEKEFMVKVKIVFRSFFKIGTLLLLLCLAMQAGTPPGWILAGNRPTDYEVGTDSMSYQNSTSAYLRSVTPEIDGFGTLMQSFSAEKYLGQRIRFSAFVKREDVQDWAGLWMRVDSGQKVVAFDNMQNRPIKGTGDWQSYEVVLDVPQDASSISFGILLSKTGKVWLSGAKFEVVGLDIPVTGVTQQLRTEPVNLDFER
jgi:hypothetical protein